MGICGAVKSESESPFLTTNSKKMATTANRLKLNTGLCYKALNNLTTVLIGKGLIISKDPMKVKITPSEAISRFEAWDVSEINQDTFNRLALEAIEYGEKILFGDNDLFPVVRSQGVREAFNNWKIEYYELGPQDGVLVGDYSAWTDMGLATRLPEGKGFLFSLGSGGRMEPVRVIGKCTGSEKVSMGTAAKVQKEILEQAKALIDGRL